MRLLWWRAVRVVAVNVAIFILLCALVEGCVRLAHPELGPLGTEGTLIEAGRYGPTPGLRPGAAGTTNGAAVAVDRRGLWRYAAARPGNPGWLFLGDSVTMGLGVPADSTFAGRVVAAQDSLDVLNPSLIGYSSADYRRVLRAWLGRADLPVRRVTVFWTLNDVYADLPVATAPQGPRRVAPALHRFVLRHVRLYQWLRAALFDRPQAYYTHDRSFYVSDTTAHLRAALEDLTAMHRRSRESGVEMRVVLLPYAAQLGTGDRLPQQTMARLLAERGISSHDLLPAFEASPEGRALYLYGDGIHLSAAGHRLVARALLGAP